MKKIKTNVYGEDVFSARMYCVKCRTKQYPQNIQLVTMKDGRQAYKGQCFQCGTMMFKLGVSQNDESYQTVLDRQMLLNILQSKLT